MTSHPIALTLSVLLAAGLALAPALAAAQVDESADARARAHFSAATAYYDEGDYAQAVVEFRAAYDLSRRAGLLYNVYLCEERLGHLAEAITALEGYLGSDATIENRSTLESRLTHLRERQAAGESTVEEEPEVHVSEPNAVAIAGFSVAALGVVGFAVFGPITLAEDGRLRGSCSPSCPASEAELIGATSIASDVSLGVALAGAVVGVIGLVLPVHTSEANARLRLGPASASLEGSF